MPSLVPFPICARVRLLLVGLVLLGGSVNAVDVRLEDLQDAKENNRTMEFHHGAAASAGIAVLNNGGVLSRKNVTSPPVAKINHAMAAVQGKVYSLGGGTQTGGSPSASSYDPRTNEWATLPVMSTGRQQLAADAHELADTPVVGADIGEGPAHPEVRQTLHGGEDPFHGRGF